ncbi:pilus assembly protein TadF [Enterovibrio makurazakiensis]|uniref:tight adherence pilus pseudopilin TadF n=1 Tax=Enterovibrio makurazakiensis TaxID=2910232 RepID=UPI003D1FA0F7
MTNLANKQRGTFTIELVVILIAFSFICVFTMDVVSKQAVVGKLDRLSYSTVSLVKERTQLFDGEDKMTISQTSTLFRLVSTSLDATMNGFESSRLGMVIEQQRFNSEQQPISAQTGVNIFDVGDYGCAPVKRLSLKSELAPVTNFGNRLTLYQITLCYKTDNMFGKLMGETWELARSTSISVGR